MQEEQKERWSKPAKGITAIAAAGIAAVAIVATMTSSHPAATSSIALAGGDAAAGKVATVNCPTVADKLPAVPASAAAEVQRNLTLLQTQIDEADKRLVDTVGQGGANFVQNAILGPLKDKRVATVNRIATAIGRTAAKPTGLDALAPCVLDAGGVNTGGGANNGAATPSAAATAGQQAGG